MTSSAGRWALAAILAAALAEPSAVGAADDTPAVPLAPVTPPADWLPVIEAVAPGVHLIHQAEPFQVDVVGNVVVIEQSDGLVLFDAASTPGSGARAVALIRSVSPKPVKAVAISHWHSDHHGGLPAILKAWPDARVIASAMTASNIATLSAGTPAAPDPAADLEGEKQIVDFARTYLEQSRGPGLSASEIRGYQDLYTLTLQEGIDARGAYLVVPKVTFTDQMLLDDPVNPVELRFLGIGNTDGDIVAWLPKSRILAAGDLVVSPVPYGIAVYPTPWLRTLERVQAIDYATLLPGHGGPLRGKSYVEAMKAALVAVQTQTAALAAQGLSLDEVRARADFSAQADRFAGDDPWRRRWFFRYWTKPLIGCVYRELKGQPMVKPAGSKTCSGPGSLGPG